MKEESGRVERTFLQGGRAFARALWCMEAKIVHGTEKRPAGLGGWEAKPEKQRNQSIRQHQVGQSNISASVSLLAHIG